MGNTVGSPENARTFTNSAAHTGNGLRSSLLAREPRAAGAWFAVSACVLIEPRASPLLALGCRQSCRQRAGTQTSKPDATMTPDPRDRNSVTASGDEDPERARDALRRSQAARVPGSRDGSHSVRSADNP